ncbi:hypothetical protein MAR_014692 [Mya arenaria]|uniref:Uncharacterized protein n=1 Tax=Mya arenaria TaxID=6604 RepID=A0ABY7FEW5_MYAAR|nr:hypothetical protein MAR_014692 [Mya arenaria]
MEHSDQTDSSESNDENEHVNNNQVDESALVVCEDNRYTNPTVVYTGEDAGSKMIECLLKEEKQILEILSHIQPMDISKEEREDIISKATYCCICKKAFTLHDRIQAGIRGGISQIAHRHAKANNPYLPDYDASLPTIYLQYLDANNLYGWAMNQPRPTMENVRRYKTIEIIHNKKRLDKVTAKPTYKDTTILNEDLVAVELYKSKVNLVKPIFCGMSILDLSKCLMYDFCLQTQVLGLVFVLDLHFPPGFAWFGSRCGWTLVILAGLLGTVTVALETVHVLQHRDRKSQRKYWLRTDSSSISLSLSGSPSSSSSEPLSTSTSSPSTTFSNAFCGKFLSSSSFSMALSSCAATRAFSSRRLSRRSTFRLNGTSFFLNKTGAFTVISHSLGPVHQVFIYLFECLFIAAGQFHLLPKSPWKRSPLYNLHVQETDAWKQRREKLEEIVHRELEKQDKQ